MTIKVHEIITSEAKLPLEIIKGNFALRNKKSKQYYKKFYSELNHKCNGKYCTIKDIENALNNTLSPHKINYKIEPETDIEYLGGMRSDVQNIPKNNKELYVNHVGYRILLPLEQNLVKNKYTVFHEVRHLFDHICNPKFDLLRCGKALNYKNVDDDNKNLFEFFFEDVYEPMSKKRVRTKANELVKKVPRPIAIDSLQKIRYTLITEINAYNEELLSLLKDGQIFEYLRIKTVLGLNCRFKTKLAFVNKTLKDLIGQERQDFKKSL